jgi:uncharacterized Fe-S cluster-containing radical SAM superfamily protein
MEKRSQGGGREIWSLEMAEHLEGLRKLCIRPDEQRLLIGRIAGTPQEGDLTVPPNCHGFGRLRHFKRSVANGWPLDPLPIDPANKALGFPPVDMVVAQVFQVAACDWRCWYCFVPESALRGDSKRGRWFSASDLVDLYLAEDPRPLVIDLSGGSPNLVPEWVPWMMTEIKKRNLEKNIYLWSDDNLSNYLFWSELSNKDHELICTYENYGRVGCFKGYDDISFAFNTGASADLFSVQFDVMSKLHSFGLDLYGYTTFTTASLANMEDKIKRFIDSLQSIHENLPLRTVPLLIHAFTPVKLRLDPIKEVAIKNQWYVAESWNKELSMRFSSELREMNVADIPM